MPRRHSLTGDLYRAARHSNNIRAATFSLLSRLLFAIACIGLLAFVIAVIFGPRGSTLWRDAWLYDGVINAASFSALSITWSRRRSEQLGRIVVAIGMVIWSLGDITWEIWKHHAQSVPVPSVADGFYLAMYPCFYVGLLLVRRGRGSRPSLSARLDGLVIGLGVACIYSFVVDPAFRNMTGGRLAVITGSAYPIGDLLLAALSLALLATLGWRFDRFMALFVLGCALFFLADIHFQLLSARGTYQEGTLWDAGWPGGLVFWSLAVRQREPHVPWRAPGMLATLVAPITVATTAVAVLVAGNETTIPNSVIGLAAAALVAVLLRTTLSFREVAGVAEARRQALTDVLTGLPNRRSLSQSIRETLASTSPLAHALVIVGLETVGEITDAFGYVVSDQLLVDVSRRLTTATSEPALIVRFREDQFALWMPLGPDRSCLPAFVEQLLMAMSVPFRIETIRSTVRAHIGIALFPEHSASEVDLLQHTEAALLQARRTGSKYEIYHTVGTGSGRDRLILLEELRLATKSEQLVCHYQPKVEIATGRVVGAEALVRWEHPRLGLLGPDIFLPLAQDAQLLSEVSRRVLNLAVKQSADWMSRGLSLKIAVNVTVTDLLDVDLASFVEGLLQLRVVPPSSLVIEVTEEAFMREPETVRNTLLSLHESGIELSIDDFGSGYSSLAYLRSIPADELKLDRSFVTGIASDVFDRSVVIATVGLAHSLGMRLVAEGVESQSDAETLAVLGCDLAQGYYVSRPLSAASFEQWMAANSPFTAIVPSVSRSSGMTVAGV